MLINLAATQHSAVLPAQPAFRDTFAREVLHLICCAYSILWFVLIVSYQNDRFYVCAVIFQNTPSPFYCDSTSSRSDSHCSSDSSDVDEADGHRGTALGMLYFLALFVDHVFKYFQYEMFCV